ncbi:MAG: tRNA lysidine(34) synthetase TilS [Woeseiaceae bacterium]|nr:tRNA lysidine(34) synthetase TilS [Woeseiaceae bacterium]
MTFSPASLLDRLDTLESGANKPGRYIIALSGGLDSCVLANALAATRDRHSKSMLAVHVDHQLHPESAKWSDHCRQLAAGYGIDFIAETVEVDVGSGSGLEAAARDARYKALARHMQHDDWLLSAHHRDDQAETLLLNLMRGSGAAGLAGIGAINPFAGGWLVRPLIHVSRRDLQRYAAEANLDWLDDPANEDRRFDRNYLRHSVLPILEERWPDVTKRLARSADLAGEAASLLEDLAEHDLRDVGDRPGRIEIGGLQSLSEERKRNLLRHAIRRSGLPVPGAAKLRSVLEQLIPAKQDAQPLVAWPGVEIRRYRDNLYILPAGASQQPADDGQVLGDTPLQLPQGLGTLSLSPGVELGLDEAIIEQGLTVHYRRGGEEIQPVGQAHTRKLKKLLQEEGVVPWMRERLPLVYAGGQLVAVADLWIASAAASKPGTAIRWREKPVLH